MKTLLKMCEVSTAICSSPIGHLTITYCPLGLHSMSQISTIDDKTFIPDERQLIVIQSSNGKDSPSKSCLKWLEYYFHSPNKLLKAPELCPDFLSKSNSFQKKVWQTLLTHVQFGQTITYKQLAVLSGNKNASRAVGTAMKRNPFQLIVPCHRVIRSNGVTGNYAGGERNNVKRWLLKHEQN